MCLNSQKAGGYNFPPTHQASDGNQSAGATLQGFLEEEQRSYLPTRRPILCKMDHNPIKVDFGIPSNQGMSGANLSRNATSGDHEP